MSRDYCFTAWDKPVHCTKNVRYIIWGEEFTKNSRLHYQGFVIFNRTCRFPQAKKWIGAGDETHIEPRHGTRQQAREYCMKDGEYIEDGLFEALTKDELFKMPIAFLKANYMEFYCRYHRGLEKLNIDKGERWRDVHVTWLWGTAGCGKTRIVMEMDNVYKHDGVKWWDGYEGEDILLLDDLDCGDFENRKYMLNILDGYRLRLEIKGSFCYAKWSKVFITTNWDPSLLLAKDGAFRRRCHVVTGLG